MGRAYCQHRNCVRKRCYPMLYCKIHLSPLEDYYCTTGAAVLAIQKRNHIDFEEAQTFVLGKTFHSFGSNTMIVCVGDGENGNLGRFCAKEHPETTVISIDPVYKKMKETPANFVGVATRVQEWICPTESNINNVLFLLVRAHVSALECIQRISSFMSVTIVSCPCTCPFDGDKDILPDTYHLQKKEFHFRVWKSK